MRRTILLLLIAICAATSEGCLCCGICTKRENELCCPTDIRKTHCWCFGEDAIMRGPCGPKEELYGYEPTYWRAWPTTFPAECDDGEFVPQPTGPTLPPANPSDTLPVPPPPSTTQQTAPLKQRSLIPPAVITAEDDRQPPDGKGPVTTTVPVRSGITQRKRADSLSVKQRTPISAPPHRVLPPEPRALAEQQRPDRPPVRIQSDQAGSVQHELLADHQALPAAATVINSVANQPPAAACTLLEKPIALATQSTVVPSRPTSDVVTPIDLVQRRSAERTAGDSMTPMDEALQPALLEEDVPADEFERRLRAAETGIGIPLPLSKPQSSKDVEHGVDRPLR